LTDAQTARLIEDIERLGVDKRPTFDLNRRERQVLQYAADGLTAEQTADTLGLATETVKTFRKLASRKLGARSITHAVALALRDGRIL
jgi:DNA-binding CsgD family transcriptional regulator